MKLAKPLTTILVPIFLALAASTTQAESCVERRVAFDIGSATTKMKVADVDVCRNVVLKVLDEREEKVDYMENLSQSQNPTFSTMVKEQ